MRQAGRYLPEYLEARGDRDLLTVVRDPQVVVELTLQPLRRMDLDAAILFSDIMVPIAAAGVDVKIERGVGPIVAHPLREEGDLERLRLHEPEEEAAFVAEAIRLLVEELEVPLIGFAGGPFTLASYLVEGGPSRDHRRTKALMHDRPDVFARLMDRLGEIVLDHLKAQIEAGVSAVQLFDSWAGTLEPIDYAEHVLPISSRIFAALEDLGVPRIHFGVGTSHLLPLIGAAGAEVVGVDWRLPIDRAWDAAGRPHAVQGNLDPAACIGAWETVERKASAVLQAAKGRPGHIFNLGHGVLPDTPPENLERLVDLVHEQTAR